MFEKKTYIERRESLKRKLKSGKLLFIGNDECGMNYEDNTYHFRQDSTFLYYFGISKPGLIALIDVDENREYIFGDNPTIDSIVWTGSQPKIDELAGRCGIENTGSITDFVSKVGTFAKGNIRFLPPYRAEHKLKLQE